MIRPAPLRWLLLIPASGLALTALGCVSSASHAHSPEQLGVNVLWYYNGSDSKAQITDKARKTFAYVRGLGANSVAINYPFYMSSPTADKVSTGSGTPSPQQLEIAVQTARHYHLRVTLRPLLDEQSFGTNSWRGTLDPTSRSEWFKSYYKLLRDYLVMAQSAGAQQLTIGTELTSLQDDGHWTGLVGQIRQVYHGQLLYSNNWDQLASNTAGSVADLQGLDAYMPLQLNNNASVGSIVAAWNKWLDGIPQSVHVNDMLLTEVGIPAQPGAYHKPYGGGNANGPINPAIQRNWFAAACQVMHQRGMAGIYYWRVTFGRVPGTFDASKAPPASIIGRGSTAIQQCFRG